jgi:hypothetical protein
VEIGEGDVPGAVSCSRTADICRNATCNNTHGDRRKHLDTNKCTCSFQCESQIFHNIYTFLIHQCNLTSMCCLCYEYRSTCNPKGWICIATPRWRKKHLRTDLTE